MNVDTGAGHDPDTPDIAATMEEAIGVRLARLSAKRAASKPSAPPAAARRPGDAPTKKRRRHPALGSRWMTFVISAAASGGLIVQFSRSVSSPVLATVGVVSSATVPTQPAGSSATQSTQAPGASTQVNGRAETNKYGPVQVQVTFAGGKITGVRALATPTRDSESVRINDAAIPKLNSEALAAQSASVNTVSGATYTSNSYRRSLQSAIDAGRAAGVMV